jgi:ABC-2 type transport system permease protein
VFGCTWRAVIGCWARWRWCIVHHAGTGLYGVHHTQTQQQAIFFSWFFMVFMILLGGLFIPSRTCRRHPRRDVPEPMRYFVAISAILW